MRKPMTAPHPSSISTKESDRTLWERCWKWKGDLDYASRVPRLTVWMGLGFVVLALTIRAISINVPVFDWDEYAFALAARDVLHGRLPYTGIFDNKPVGLVYLFTIFEWICGQTILSLHAVGFIASSLTGWLLYHSNRQQKLSSALGFAIAALFLFQVLYCDGWASMSELVACPFLAWANFMVLQGDWRRPRFLIGFGAIFGIACQISYLTVPCLALMAPGILLLGERQPLSASLRDAALMVLGFSV